VNQTDCQDAIEVERLPCRWQPVWHTRSWNHRCYLHTNIHCSRIRFYVFFRFQ